MVVDGAVGLEEGESVKVPTVVGCQGERPREGVEEDQVRFQRLNVVRKKSNQGQHRTHRALLRGRTHTIEPSLCGLGSDGGCIHGYGFLRVGASSLYIRGEFDETISIIQVPNDELQVLNA